MRTPSLRSALLSAVTMFAMVDAQSPAQAFVVFDPSNFAENVEQAASALTQIQNQVTSLEHEVTMLENEAKNLTSLDYSSLAAIDGNEAQIQNLLREASRISYDVQTIETAFSDRYGSANLNASDADLVSAAEERWKDASAAFEDAMNVQAGAVGNLNTVKTEADTLVSRSQSAVGILQAAQAGNQLLALQTTQLADLTAVLAADGRARALDSAGNDASEAQAKEQYRRFLTNAEGYQPAAVQMFH